jgi:hypothetical protein
MARYRALERGYDNVKVREVGEEFEFEGMPGPWMEPIDEDGNPVNDSEPQKKKSGRPPKVQE